MQTLCCFRAGRTLSNHDNLRRGDGGQSAEQQQAEAALQQADAGPWLDDEGHCTASITFTKSAKKGDKTPDIGCDNSLDVKLVRPGK
jgi:hypothetical protein